MSLAADFLLGTADDPSGLGRALASLGDGQTGGFGRRWTFEDGSSIEIGSREVSRCHPASAASFDIERPHA
ncbi:hypothetical protein [Xylophilus sp.]|uniref:hypothetical protein n=1 Tax=Xylophilus sp. TaxID=2653893 RepID=UPI0013B6AC2C|nr:hypothetical protein [Xylophilus sp.]KAF1044207.1 MAG: hypothetical protein GAK38_03636 [Xylophilus sp.]